MTSVRAAARRTWAQVIDAVVAACADAAVSLERFPVADLGVYCLAGADLPVDDRRIARWLRSRGLTGDDLVRNDTFAVLRAGTDRTWGVGVVCGYGTNCSGVSPDGRITGSPRSDRSRATGAAEPRSAAPASGTRSAPRTAAARRPRCAHLVPEHFGLRRPKQVLEALYLGRLDEARPRRARARRVPRRDRAAIRSRAASSTGRPTRSCPLASTAIKRLRMAALDVDVVLGGGIFRNRRRGLLRADRRRPPRGRARGAHARPDRSRRCSGPP